jgi:hypothetical protein
MTDAEGRYGWRNRTNDACCVPRGVVAIFSGRAVLLHVSGDPNPTLPTPGQSAGHWQICFRDALWVLMNVHLCTSGEVFSITPATLTESLQALFESISWICLWPASSSRTDPRGRESGIKSDASLRLIGRRNQFNHGVAVYFPASSDRSVHSCQYIWRIVKPICFAVFRLITDSNS